MNSYPTRFWRDGTLHTELIHTDALGHHVPLLDHTGEPVNFMRKPMALQRAIHAMTTATRLWQGTGE